LSAMMSSHCFGVTSPNGVRTMTAAEFTSTSSEPNFCRDGGDECVRRFGVREVSGDRVSLAAGGSNLFDRFLGTRGRRVVMHCDAHASTAQRECDRASDAMARSSYQCDSVAKLHALQCHPDGCEATGGPAFVPMVTEKQVLRSLRSHQDDYAARTLTRLSCRVSQSPARASYQACADPPLLRANLIRRSARARSARPAPRAARCPQRSDLGGALLRRRCPD
jgi:hypothetical protein